MADFFADGRAARLAQEANVVAERAQLVREQFHLRRFTAAFRALKCDEKTCSFKWRLTI